MADYPWMTYEEVEEYIPEMEKYKVSEVARGVKESSQSDRGFLEVYEEVRDPKEMETIPIKSGSSQNWAQRRQNFISRHMAQYEGNPTYRRWLALIAWAYLPPKLH